MRVLDFAVARFALTGLANSAAGLLVIYAAKFMGLGDIASNAIGYGAGLLLGFALHRRWTFGDRRPATASLPKFIAVTLVAYFANLGVVLALVAAGLDGYLAQACGVPVYAGLTFLGYRHIAFAAKLEQSRHAQ